MSSKPTIDVQAAGLADPSNTRETRNRLEGSPVDSRSSLRASLARLNILLIACFDGQNAPAITDHINALERYSKHRVFVYNHFPALAAGEKDLPVKLDLHRFDAIIIHYSIYVLNEPVDYLNQSAKQRIADFRGVKTLFRQDEYNNVHGLIHVLSTLGVDILFTNFLSHEARRVYPAERLPRLRLVSNFTGYVADNFLSRSGPPIAERSIEVGYRSRELPFWLGQLGLEKTQIAIGFARIARGHGLATDISVRESDRIYGEAWPAFLANCRAVLGTETGASVIDFTGEIRRNCDLYVAAHPHATFDEVRDLYFSDCDGLYGFEQLSPRHFEAACMRTGMILFEGNYSGVLQPWRHYIPLRKDFTNSDEVVAALRDNPRMQDMVDRTRAEIAENPRYHFRHLVNRVDEAIEHAFAQGRYAPVADAYCESTFILALRPPYRYRNLGFEPVAPIVLRSPLKTEFKHPFSNAINNSNDGDPALVVHGQPLPQEFEMLLPRTFAVHQIRLIWESSENRPLNYSFELFRGSRLADIVQVRNNAAVDVITQINWCACDRIRVQVDEFFGEQRIMLRNAEVYGIWQPLGALRIRPQLRAIWVHLPLPVRQRIRAWAEKVLTVREPPIRRAPSQHDRASGR